MVIYLTEERGCTYNREMTEELARILTVLKRSAGQIQQKYKATILGVFGSYVRGEQTHGSDLDLLVRFHVGLGNFLEEQLGLKVDLVSERAVATASNARIRLELKDRILQEVVLV
jgi:predicted nucleotidyltransferase